MCMMSAVSDHWMAQYPVPDPSKVAITLADYLEYQRLKKMAQELDEKLKQPDCVKPGVDEWEKKIEEVLKKKGLL